jgi:lactate dehydrogenase-like 2-hydroxyacid dehydrogenase
VDAVILPWHTEVMDKEPIGVAKNLKIIGRHGVGYENIDLEAAADRGIYVTLTPVHTPTVADTERTCSHHEGGSAHGAQSTQVAIG